MNDNCANEKYVCWHGRDDDLKKCIEKSKFVKKVRKKLSERKIEKYPSSAFLINSK